MSHQTIIFLATVLLGVLTGFAYDLLRVFRRIIRHNKIAMHFEDCVFWISAAIFIFFFLLTHNFGEVRIFAIVGVLLGMLLYFIIASPLFMRLAVGFVSIVLGGYQRKIEKVLSKMRKYVKMKNSSLQNQMKIIRNKE
ncbi:MAG: spore cortex biosynthesis protein YabQ [Defluviitaleaceae bacterium]|nr:spore cortex biosynthesis protein YabQ [Defluviitaleaceae bacterium]